MRLFCLQAFLKSHFITDDVIKLDEEQHKPRDWLSWTIKECIHNQDSRIPYIPCETWSRWSAKFAHLACFFDYNPTTNELSLSDRSRSKLKSVLLIQHLNTDDEMLSPKEDFGTAQTLRNGTVLTFKVPDEFQRNINHKDLKLMVRFYSNEEDLNYAKLILENNYGSSLPADNDPRPSSSASSTTTRPQSTITGAPTRTLVLLLLFAVAILLL